MENKGNLKFIKLETLYLHILAGSQLNLTKQEAKKDTRPGESNKFCLINWF